jgi:hypothetical protein
MADGGAEPAWTQLRTAQFALDINATDSRNPSSASLSVVSVAFPNAVLVASTPAILLPALYTPIIRANLL